MAYSVVLAAGLVCVAVPALAGFGPPALFHPSSVAGVDYYAHSGAMSASVAGRTVRILSGGASVQLDFHGSRGSAAPQPRKRAAVEIRRVWASGSESVDAFEEIFWKDLYTGIDATYTVGSARLKSTFVVHPGADPANVRIRIRGHEKLEVSPKGELLIHTSAGCLTESRPEVYQEAAGVKHRIASAFRVTGDTVMFDIADFDPSLDLIIDPVMTASVRMGGGGTDIATAVAVDGNGYIYAAGYTDSNLFPVTAATAKPGGVDIFVAKWRPGARSLVYCTWIGGSGDDRAFALAVNAAGEVYVTGQTTSGNFPLFQANRTQMAGSSDAFILRLSASGTLAWSTYWGGSGADTGTAVAVDDAGKVYVAGSTGSIDIPVTSSAVQPRTGGNADVFLVKVSPAGNAVEASTYLGGQGDDFAAGIAVDRQGNIVLTGRTASSNFPVPVGAFRQSRGLPDAFVTKLDTTGQTIVFSTYLGGSAPGYLFEGGTGVATDDNGDVYVAGNTRSADFPVLNGFAALRGGQDGFVARFSPSGLLLFSGFVGGSLYDDVRSVGIDKSGAIFIGGYTSSTDFPAGSAPSPAGLRPYDGFVSRLKPDGSVAETRFLTGNDMDTVNAISVRRPSTVITAGQTNSADYPATAAAGSIGGIDATTAVFANLPRDFDANGSSDIIVQNQADNRVSVWYLGGASGVERIAAPVIAAAASGWRVAASSDFDRDGHPDIVLQNDSSFAVSIWYMSGPTGATIRSSPVVAYAVPGWRAIGAADFDRDGYSDLVLRNGSALSVWFLGGTQGSAMQSSILLPDVSGSWEFVAATDFSGDGIPDLTFREKTTNELTVRILAGSRTALTVASTYSLGVAVPGWLAQGWGDFDGNGCPDLILENNGLLLLSVWYFGGIDCRTRLDAPVVGSKVAGWNVAGTR
jgi:hypothetical protein